MIDTDKYEGHTRGPWVWNDDWCSALIGLPNKDADIYDEDAQTVIGVNTKHTPICGSFYTDEHDVRQEAFPEERLRNDALRAEDALLIADAPLLLAEVERLREGRLDLINEVVRIINNKTGERVDADLHDYIIDRLVNE